MHVNLDGKKDPATLYTAINGPNGDKWVEAIQEKLASMKENDEWKIVTKPAHAKIISHRWIFRSKDVVNGAIKLKARLVLVARGFEDENEHDVQDIFAPVVKIGVVRWLIAIANKIDLDLRQLDVRTAFLYDELETPVSHHHV